MAIRPFLTQCEKIAKLAMECTLLIAFILIGALTKENASDEFKTAINWTIIGILGFLVGAFAVYIIFTGLVTLILGIVAVTKNLITKIKHSKKARKVQPNQSDDASLAELSAINYVENEIQPKRTYNEPSCHGSGDNSTTICIMYE